MSNKILIVLCLMLATIIAVNIVSNYQLYKNDDIEIFFKISTDYIKFK